MMWIRAERKGEQAKASRQRRAEEEEKTGAGWREREGVKRVNE